MQETRTVLSKAAANNNFFILSGIAKGRAPRGTLLPLKKLELFSRSLDELADLGGLNFEYECAVGLY